MADTPAATRLMQILISEESIYGLILVSGMIVVSNSLTGTSVSALITVIVTVAVFFAAHVYAGTLARFARGTRQWRLRASFVAALHHSEGMLLVATVPIAVLLLGVTQVLDDEVAIWTALAVDTVFLGVLGWFAVAPWTRNVWIRLGSALLTAAFGGVLILLKAFIHH